MRRAAAISLVALAFAGCGGSDRPSTDPTAPGSGAEEAGGFDSNRAFDDLRAQVEIGPRPAGSAAARETAELIAGGMREAGLEAVSIQAPRENVLGTIPGDLPGTVIVGAHYDTEDIPRFVGANDGASGVAVLLELARALPARLAGPTVQLVAFDAEESPGDSDFDRFGTRGSRQYVDYARAGGEQGSAPLNEIRAMVLFDMVGDCDLQIPYEQNSDEDLYALFAVTAAELNNGNADPFRFNTFPVGDDHEPFLQAGIPAVDFIDFTYGPGAPPGLYWHTPKDTIDKVCPASLDTVGEVALRAIPKIR